MTLQELQKLFRLERLRFIASIFLGSLVMIFSVALLASSGWLISRASQQPPVLTLEIAIVAVRTFALGRAVLRYAERLISHDVTFRALAAIRVAIFSKIETLVPGQFATFKDSDLVTRVVTDIDELQNFPLRVILPISSGTLAALASVTISASILPDAGIVLGVALLTTSFLSVLTTDKILLTSTRSTANLRAKLRDGIADLIDGMTEITSLNSLPSIIDEIEKDDNKLGRIAKRNAFASGFATSTQLLIQGTTILLTFVVAIPAVTYHQIEGVLLAVLVLIPLAAFEATSGFPNAIIAYRQLQGSATRIQELLISDPITVDGNQEVQISGNINSLSLSRITARWTEDHNAITDITFELTKRSRLAVIGQSGSGKSTIAAVVLRHLLPTSGDYEINSENVANISWIELHEHCVGMSGDAHIFGTTVRENLTLAWMKANERPADEDLLNALKSVHLIDWLNGLPNGLDSLLSPNGSNMSAGQQQRLRLARIHLAKPDVWVLDEPTEYLNNRLADAVMSNVLNATRDNTLILMSHRMADTTGCDIVLLLDHGHVAEFGSRAELQNSQTRYRELLDIELSALNKMVPEAQIR
ncbi:MAG: thiol reductant ABC exporter subunit CydC [Actinomycetes bacterium]